MTPNYPTGERIQVGDKVLIGHSLEGVVVGVIDDGRYADGYSEEGWGHYETGVMVHTEEAGLILYAEDHLIADFRKLA